MTKTEWQERLDQEVTKEMLNLDDPTKEEIYYAAYCQERKKRIEAVHRANGYYQTFKRWQDKRDQLYEKAKADARETVAFQHQREIEKLQAALKKAEGRANHHKAQAQPWKNKAIRIESRWEKMMEAMGEFDDDE